MPGESVMLILDSNHTSEHVYGEMRQLSSLVTDGQYMVVEDGIIDGVYPIFSNGGPLSAIKKFLKEQSRFSVDWSRNKFLLTQNPSGFLLCGQGNQTLTEANDLVRPLKMWLPGVPFKMPGWSRFLNQGVRR
jgi:hypothetical protein